MNAPEKFLTAHLGEAEVRVPERLAIAAYLEQQMDLLRPLPLVAAPPGWPNPQRLPEIGDPWSNAELEVIYAGLTIHEGAPHALLLLPGDMDDGTWEAAKAWAHVHAGELPSRIDALVLFQNLRGHFKKETYWTSEQPAGVAGCAWFQTFLWGTQSYYYVSSELRARAVRRVPI